MQHQKMPEFLALVFWPNPWICKTDDTKQQQPIAKKNQMSSCKQQKPV